MDHPHLQVVAGTAAPATVDLPTDPVAFQASCVEAFATSQAARGFSPITIETDTGVLERFLVLAGKPAWELSADDVDQVVAALVQRGVGAVTRRDYVTTFKQFFGWLQTRRTRSSSASACG